MDITAATYIPATYTDIDPPSLQMLDFMKNDTSNPINYEWFGSGTLLQADELMTGLSQGVADLVFQTSSYVASTYQILGLYALPFLLTDGRTTKKALDPSGELFELVNQRLSTHNVRLLGSVTLNPQWIWTVDRKIETPGDLKGLRIRTAGEAEGRTLEALGAAPVAMGSPEVYEALSRGTIDGIVSYPGTITNNDLQDIVRYCTMTPVGSYTQDAYVRADWYNSLGEPYQELLSAAGQMYWDEGSDHAQDVITNQYLGRIEEAGVEMHEPSADEIAEFTTLTESVYDWWVGEMDDKEVAQHAIELVRQTSA